MKFYKYTPSLLDPQTLEDTLIGRDLELDNLKRILKGASSGKSFSHPILVGPKGIGKTHILRIIYHAIKGEIKTKGLNAFKDKFVPVIFSEEEYPGSVTKFLLLALHYLRESKPDGIPQIPAELMDAVTIGAREKELALSYIKTFKKKTGKLLLLLVDNLNDIIERFTDEDQSSLREILMTYDSILFIGAAPTLFDSIINHDKPFYNFFEIIWLKDLPFEEATALLERYATLDDRNDRNDLIEKFKNSEPKLRAIHELAGGNPRLILSLYHIAVEGDITHVENTLLKLLDDLNPYFRERMADIPAQQSEIIDIIAKAEKLLTPTEIAARCHLAVNVVNSQLKRLENIGYVKKHSEKPKRVLYDLKERLFSLWRQMRVEAGRKRLGFIVRFLEMWFTKEELFAYLDSSLEEIRKKLLLDHDEIQADMDKLWYLKEAIPEFKGDDEICVACQRKDYAAALKMAEKILKNRPDDVEILYKLGCIYLKLKRYDKAIEACKKVLSIKPELSKAWFNLGIAYADLNQNDYAIEAYKKAVAIKPKMPNAWYNLGNIFSRNLKKYGEAIEAYKKAIEIKPDKHEAWNNLGIAFRKLKRYDEAIQAYKKAIEIKPDKDGAWNNLGNTYKELKRYDEAIEACKKAIEINPDKYKAWNNLGNTYKELKRYDEAIEACKKSIELQPNDNPAWHILGTAYFALKQLDEALEAFKKATEITDCKHCIQKGWFGVWSTYVSKFIHDGIRDDMKSAMQNLKESLNCIRFIEKISEPLEGYTVAFKDIIKGKKIDLIKIALKEIETANQPELLEALSPYSTLLKYLETKDPEIIDRLRYEERIVIEDMLKMLGENTEEKPKKLKRN